ncbi:UDP-glucose dehydrogenase family protein, partial [Stomatohabitans albus]
MTRSLSVVVLGIGHVGLVTVATLASLGHQVVGFDVNPDVIAQVGAGDIHFYEPGLADLLQEGVQAGHLRFSSDPADAIAGADIAMICVGTPSEPAMNGEDGLDLSMVKAAAQTVITHATQPVVIVEKSTVPPGTGDRIEDLVALHGKGDLITVASNPEFLREGQAVADTLRPDRIVVGANDEHTHQVLADLYAPQLAVHPSAYVATDRVTAEITKQASNAFLALKISFINEVAALCEHVGADITTVADGMGHDPRIGRAFLNAGIGYGGSCFPKDVSGLSAVYESHHLPETTISGAHWVNEEAKRWPVKTLAKAL